MITARNRFGRRPAAAVILAVLVLTVWPLPSGAEQPFVPGSVIGRGQALRFGGFTGGLEYALTLGVALARAQGQQGNAQAQVIDLGVFGLVLSQPGECTGTAVLPPDQVPRPLRVNSVKGQRSATNTFVDGELIRGGKESAAASPDPSASATAEVGEVDLAPVISFDGLRSTADARIAARAGRRDSNAAVSVGTIDLGGIVRLEDVRWTTSRTTGKPDAAEGGFTVGRITVAGLEIPATTPPDLTQAFGTLNSVLAGAGIVLEAPAFNKRKDGTVEVTPLVVNVGGNDQANPAIGALFQQLQPIRDQVYAAAQESGCPVDKTYVNAVLTVFDIALASFTGSGGLRFEIGGVRTLHDTTFFESPLGLPPSFFTQPPPPGTASRFVPGTNTPAVPPREQAQPGIAGRASTRCETTHPSGSPGCSRGSATLAGIASLVLVLGLVGAETYRSRRRRGIA